MEPFGYIVDASGAERPVPWSEWWQLEKDLLLLMHLLAGEWQDNGAHWSTDWFSNRIFSLPYWDYLALRGSFEPPSQETFIRNACLLWILGLSVEQIDEMGSDLDAHVEEIERRLSEFDPTDDPTRRLFLLTRHLFAIARDGTTGRTSIGSEQLAELDWAFDTVVRKHYSDSLELIDKTPE